MANNNKLEEEIEKIFEGLDFAEWARDPDEYYQRVKDLLSTQQEELIGVFGKDWIPVKGFEGLYEVNSCGQVRSLERKTMGRWNKNKTSHGKVLVPEIMKNGYLRINLCKEGKIEKQLIHRVVAKTFLDNPNNLPCVNHKDLNKTNNHIENLEWCTHKENTHHATLLGVTGRPKKIRLFTKEQVLSLIGEDEIGAYQSGHIEVINPIRIKNISIRNKLRAEQRKALDNLRKEGK